MPKKVSPFSPRVIRKAAPALLLAFLILLSLIFLIRYTEAFYLVILLWIVMPVAAVKIYRRLRRAIGRGKE